jgi:5-methylcytosine-specific restriction endonuclease McrBC regulatory subunit McrC
MLQSMPDNEYHIESQDSQKFRQSKTIRPDIVLTHNTTKEVFIIDTKWKVFSNTEPSDDVCLQFKLEDLPQCIALS